MSPQVGQLLERVTDEYPDEFGGLEETLKRAAMLKFRDIMYETVTEFNRRGEFVRIIPARGSKIYEKFFSGAFGTRMLNRIVHKALYTSEVLVYEKVGKLKGPEGLGRPSRMTDPKNLKYDIEDVPQEQSYDHYKNKAALVRQTTKKAEGAGPS